MCMDDYFGRTPTAIRRYTRLRPTPNLPDTASTAPNRGATEEELRAPRQSTSPVWTERTFPTAIGNSHDAVGQCPCSPAVQVRDSPDGSSQTSGFPMLPYSTAPNRTWILQLCTQQVGGAAKPLVTHHVFVTLSTAFPAPHSTCFVPTYRRNRLRLPWISSARHSTIRIERVPPLGKFEGCDKRTRPSVPT